MKYMDFVKEISAQSKETERHLAQEDVKVCFEVAREVILNLLKNGDHLVIRDFLKFETKVQKGRTINAVNSNKKVEIPDTIVAKVSLSENFKKEVKKVC